MQQPLLPHCLSWSTFTDSTDSSSSCTPTWPSAIGDPGENSLAQAVSAAINSSLKARDEAAPLQRCCVSGQQGLSPGTVGRKVAALWRWWQRQCVGVDRCAGERGSWNTASISHIPDAQVQAGRDGFGALGAGMAPLSLFGKEMRFTSRVHKVCMCCQQGHGAGIIHHDII